MHVTAGGERERERERGYTTFPEKKEKKSVRLKRVIFSSTNKLLAFVTPASSG